MPIKVKLIILTAFSLIVTAVMGFILFQDIISVRKEIENQEIISAIRNKLFERMNFRDEYLLYREERPIVQLKVTSEALEQLFIQASNAFTSVDEQTLVSRLSDNNKVLDRTLFQVVANFKNQGSSPSASSKEIEEDLINQIFIELQESVNISSQLTDASRSRVIESQQGATFFVIVFIAGIILVIISTLYFIWLSIAKPLITLKEDALRIASLDFTTTTTTTTTTTGKNSNDEIGQLAHAFDEMVNKLRQFYGNLEEKVREKTKDLEEAKAQDEAILFSIGEGLAMVGKDENIIYVNKSFEEMLGWKAQEVIGKNMVEVIPREDISGAEVQFKERILSQVLSGKKFIADLTNPFYFIRKDKSRFPVSIIVTPVVLDGETVGAVETFRDITKEKEVERAKSEFVSIASHELRTPLSAIDGLTSMIREGEYGPVGEGLKQPLEDINISSVRLIHLVNDLLNLSRIQAGRLKYVLSDFPVADVITETIRLLQPVAKQKNIQLVAAEIDKSIVQGDVDKVKEVLNNLIGNSLKFTDKGSIAISTKLDGDKVKVFVVDTGIGIDPQDQAKLFGQFQQLDSGRGRSIGTGLGLHISREITRKMGGKLWIEKSERGIGSTFAFSLPKSKSELAKKAKAEIEKEAKENPDQRSDTIN